MRLGCPNCDAQYEVDDAAIPAAGRDVQCSNCGYTWFQLPKSAAAERKPAAPPPRPQRPAPPPEPAPAPPPAAAAKAPPPAPPPPSPPAADAEDDGADAPAPAAASAARRTLDDNLMSILREEAAREAAERKAEAERTMQVQPDLGLPEAPKKPPQPAPKPDPRFADLSEPEPEPEQPAQRTKPPSRRALLPDIEEINSTLRPGAEQRDGEDQTVYIIAQERRRGFGAGFLSVIALAALATLVYVLAPRLSEAVPGAAPALETYVQTVDAARIWLDGALQSATGTLRGLSGEGDTPAN